MEQLIKRVLSYEPTKNNWRTKYNSVEFQEASKLNHLLFGVDLNRSAKCECVEDLFFMLKKPQSTIKIKDEMERQYFLKKGKVLTSFKFPNAITSNSSDEELAKALELEPAIIKFFDKVPGKDLTTPKMTFEASIKEAEKEVEQEDVKEIATAENSTVEELKAILTEKRVKFHWKANEATLLALVNANS